MVKNVCTERFQLLKKECRTSQDNPQSTRKYSHAKMIELRIPTSIKRNIRPNQERDMRKWMYESAKCKVMPEY